MKKVLSVMLAVLIVLGCVPSVSFTASAKSASKAARYSILVLDISGEANFYSNSKLIYTADSAIKYVKQSANTFLSDLVKAKGENYVAVVTYAKSTEVISDFTTDIDSLREKIDKLSPVSGDVRNINGGLKAANDLIDQVDESAIKNVVLVTTGFTNDGEYTYNGHYDENTVGSNWRRISTQVKLYAYANAAYNTADIIKEKATIYVLGLFQTMDNIPENGKSVAEFFRLTAADLASSEDTLYDVENTENIGLVFSEIADDIKGDSVTAILGDVDEDGKITSVDSLLILRSSVKLEEFTDVKKQIADVNGDGKVDSVDSLIVLRYSVKIIDNPNVGKPFEIK